MSRPHPLVSFEFIALCLVSFLAYCNISIFYNLYLYLQHIQIPQAWRGFLIGCSSLSTIVCFLFASPYLTARNAPRWALAGAAILMACGPVYLVATDTAALLAVRLANGAGVYLLSAACMTMLVGSIPPDRSGQAFSLYSVAILLPYTVVPAVSGFVSPYLPSAAYGYSGMSLLFGAALILLYMISRRQGRQTRPAQAMARVAFADMYRNAASPPVAMVLLLNTLYIVAFSSIFFMAKGLFQERGYDDVGYYFSIQILCMICIRTFGNHFFDNIGKIKLIRFTFLMSAISFILAAKSTELWQLYISSLAMGIGMGFGSPALYSLMFTISSSRFKGINSNLMMLALQIGNFIGPIFSSWTMHRVGYNGFLWAAAGICVVGALLCSGLRSSPADPDALERQSHGSGDHI